jgi:nitrite reductase (NADH) large subunit
MRSTTGWQSLDSSPNPYRSKASTSTDAIGRSHAASTTGVACLLRPSTVQTARCIFLTATVFHTTASSSPRVHASRRGGCRTAVIVGAGLLGLEAAYYLTQLDVRVLVLDRGPWPLSRQLDEQAGALLWEMLQDLGIELVPRTEARRVLSDHSVTGVELIEGGSIEAELCLIATGIVPNSELAEAAGLDVAVGITVDDGMQTSDANIFAVGDVVDHNGRRYGLWPACVEQAQVAATKMAGGEATFRVPAQPARLKVPGIDLLSIGVVEARGGETRTVAVSAYGTRRYRKLILEEGRLTGAIILGSPELFDDVTKAVEIRLELGSELDALEHGKWEALSRGVEGDTLALGVSAT